MSTELTIRLRVESDVDLDADAAGEGIALTLTNFGLCDGDGHRLIPPPGARRVVYLGGFATPVGNPPRVSIHRHTYRGEEGFSVRSSRGASIFTKTRASAERIRDRLRNFEDERREDYEL